MCSLLVASRSCKIGQRRRLSNWPSHQNGKRGLNPTAVASDPDAHAKTPSNQYSMSSANNPDRCWTPISPAASILHVAASFKNPDDMSEEQYGSPPSWRERIAYQHIMYESFLIPI